METLEKIRVTLNSWFIWIAGAALLLMTGVACANMIMRPLGFPLKGAYELVGFLGAMVVSFALGYSQSTRSHIAVDIMARWYSKGMRRIIQGINSFLCSAFFLLVAWRVAVHGTTIWARGETSETLKIIYYPFIYAVALCSFLLALVLFTDFLKSLWPEKGEE